jgi:hypothetical protein
VSPQKSIWLYSDDTAKTMYVTANGQSYTIKYRLVPYKVKSKVDMVKDLGYVVPSSPATMPFATNDTGRTYTTSVGFSDSVLTLQWTRAVTSQKVIVNETELTGVNSTKIPLGLGVTEVKMKVIADDTNFVRNFSLFITRNRSSEARLATLTDTVKTDTLSPAFHSDSLAYRLSTTFGADTARLAFTTKSTLVKSVSVSGGVLEGNTLKIPLKAFGDTAKASITILAADSLTTKTYSIAARTRTAEQVAVLSGLNYALSTAAGMSSWTLATDSVLKVTGAFKDTGFAFTATRQGSLATMTLNGVAITSGVKTGYFPLVAGDTNTFKLVVTAQDTAVKKNYYLKVFRTAGLKVANLSALSLTNGTSALGLDTAFKAADSVYVVNAPFTDTAVVVTPTGPISAFKSIAVNGVEVTSGTASGKVLLTKIGDTNLVSIVVTAQDTTVKQTYLVKVFRAAASKVAGLSGLVVSNGASNLALDTAFKTADTVYVTSAAFVDTAVVVTPTGPISAFKSIAVNGVEVTSGTASGKVLLTKIGDTNSVSIVVTAQDTTVKQTYVVKVFRAAASKVAGLSGLVVTKGATTLALDSAFKTADTVYVTSVAFADTAVTVTPTKSVAVIKSITVNGTDVASATASGKILLTKIADTNVVSIVVTAQDTSVKQTYVVKVYRAAPSKNAWLKRIGASAGTLSPVFDTATSAYTLNVDNGVTDVTFAPMANDSVYGTVVVTGAPTNLVVGTAQVATLTVKAQDTTAKKVYTVSVIRSRGDSTLPSSFSTDTTLTLANSPYLVGAASFTVPLGKTLRIEPGVRIKVPVTTVGGTAVPKAFLVKGSLLARGTVAQPIVFTKASVTNWGYLLIDSTSDDATFDGTGAYTGGSILENVVVEYAGASPGAPGGLRISAASPYLHNVTVQGSSTVGVQLVNSDNQTMQAEGVVVQDNGGDGWNGVDIDWNDGSKFTNCVAQRNGGVGFNYVGMAVTMKYCSSLQNGGHGFYGVQGGDVVGLIAQGNNGWGTNNVSGKFDSCRILGNQGGGFHMGAPLYQEVTLINSEIRNNAGGYALYLHSSGVIGSYIRCDVRNNVIAGNSASHTIYYYAQRDGSIFHDNVVQDNVATATDYGSYIFGVYDNTTTSNAFSMKNNVFRNNRAPQYVIQTTDWGGNLAQIVQGNIFVGNQSTTGPVFKIGGNLNGPQIFDGNRLDSNVALTGAVIEIGGYSTNQVNFTNNAVRANRVSTGVTGSVFKINGYSSTGGKVVFAGNNFAGHKWDGVNWFLMQMEHPATGIGATATGNYWGQADSDPNMFLDATLDPSRAAIDYTGALSVPSPTAPALP